MWVIPSVFRKSPEYAEIEIGTSITCCSRFCAVTTIRLRLIALADDGVVLAGAGASVATCASEVTGSAPSNTQWIGQDRRWRRPATPHACSFDFDMTPPAAHGCDKPTFTEIRQRRAVSGQPGDLPCGPRESPPHQHDATGGRTLLRMHGRRLAASPQEAMGIWINRRKMVRPAGFEPTTTAFGGRYSIQLSYRRIVWPRAGWPMAAARGAQYSRDGWGSIGCGGYCWRGALQLRASPVPSSGASRHLLTCKGTSFGRRGEKDA